MAANGRRGTAWLGYSSLAVWCLLEWATSRASDLLNPLVYIAYFASFIVCLIFSVVLFVQSPPHRRITEERIAACLLLVPLLWNLI